MSHDEQRLISPYERELLVKRERDHFMELSVIRSGEVFDLTYRIARVEQERDDARAQLARLRAAIKGYRYWFDTCTRTLAPHWEDRAATALDELDAALAELRKETK